MSEAQILVHVRFAPDGAVVDIGEKPDTINEQEWFKRLNANAGDAYQPLAGARGVYRLDAARLNALKAAALN